jgi:sugar phosphate isomerase/epimerase
MHLLRTSLTLGLLALGLLAAPTRAHDLKIGMQTWTLRNLSFEDAMQLCAKHGIKYIQLTPNHLAFDGTREEWGKRKAYLEKLGLIPYTFGVVPTSMDKEQNRKLFECAKFMGMKLIVVEPGDYKILDGLEELAKEYDMKVVIHNHDLKSPYGNPLVVRNLIKHRDKRIGVCMDAGWIATTRLDPAKVFTEYDGRVYDIHLKDKDIRSTEQGDRWNDTFLGEGDANLPKLLQTIQAAHWDGVIAIETDNNLQDPTEHTVKALEFIKKNSK